LEAVLTCRFIGADLPSKGLSATLPIDFLKSAFPLPLEGRFALRWF
jgi:hypothetical protein